MVLKIRHAAKKKKVTNNWEAVTKKCGFLCRIYHKAAANTGSGLLPSIQNSHSSASLYLQVM